MWRNYEEDWERRKTYLIRSLFQDIPLLSPVPEDQESRYGALSPSDIPPSRPHSPLPPLVIERIQNRHDHPEQFYKDLEQKMKKLYKKLFFNARSRSIDDLMEADGGEFEFLSSIDQYDNCNNNEKELGEGSEYNDEYLYQNLDPNKSTSEKDISIQEDEIIDGASIRPLHFNNRSSFEEQGSQGVESSTQSLYATQVTIVADVHAHSDQRHEEEMEKNSSGEETIVLSPVIKLRRLNSDHKRMLTVGQEEGNVISQNDHIEETDENKASNELEDTDTSEESISNDENSETSANKQSNDENIELMRRQEIISPSIGSGPREPVGSDGSGLSITYTDVEFLKKFSLEKSDQNISNEHDYLDTRSTTSQDLECDFSTFSSSSAYEQRHDRFLREVSKQKRISFDEDSPQLVTKRRRNQNIAIQTSSFEDSENTVNWNQLRNNFFVGVPKIYKLCSCDNHSCNNVNNQ